MKTEKAPTMIAPRVHLNGNSKQSLLEPLEQAWEAINEARKALRETAPNARNYYVIGPGAYERAVAQHDSRQMRLDSVYHELMSQYEAIMDGETEFTV